MAPTCALLAALLSAGGSAQPLGVLGTSPALLRQATGARVRARAVGPDGAPGCRLRFVHAGVCMPIAGVLPGSSATSFERLAPGRHVLRVECWGCDPAEVELEAVDGEDLEVAVDLVPARRRLLEFSPR